MHAKKEFLTFRGCNDDCSAAFIITGVAKMFAKLHMLLQELLAENVRLVIDIEVLLLDNTRPHHTKNCSQAMGFGMVE